MKFFTNSAGRRFSCVRLPRERVSSRARRFARCSNRPASKTCSASLLAPITLRMWSKPRWEHCTSCGCAKTSTRLADSPSGRKLKAAPQGRKRLRSRLNFYLLYFPFMRLHDLKPRPGAKHRRKRLGQGESSGHGKTSGRGGKGQTARSGSSIRIGFEGGQMPLIRRIPKRGFNNARHTVAYVPVNLEHLNCFDNGARVDVETLRKAGLANGPVKLIKVLGDGELKKKLTVIASAFSESAKQKIEDKGGSCEVDL